MTFFKPALFALFVLFVGLSSIVFIKSDLQVEALQDKQSPS